MDAIVYEQLKKNPKMYELLKRNSYYLKELNRNPNYYKVFVNKMKEKYKIRVTDKINDVVDNIDIISNILDVFK